MIAIIAPLCAICWAFVIFVGWALRELVGAEGCFLGFAALVSWACLVRACFLPPTAASAYFSAAGGVAVLGLDTAAYNHGLVGGPTAVAIGVAVDLAWLACHTRWHVVFRRWRREPLSVRRRYG